MNYLLLPSYDLGQDALTPRVLPLTPYVLKDSPSHLPLPTADHSALKDLTGYRPNAAG